MEVFGTVVQSILGKNSDAFMAAFDIFMGFYDDENPGFYQTFLSI